MAVANFFEVDHTTSQIKCSDYRNNRLVHTWKLFSCQHVGKCCSKAWAIIPGFRQLYLRHVFEVLVGEKCIQKHCGGTNDPKSVRPSSVTNIFLDLFY